MSVAEHVRAALLSGYHRFRDSSPITATAALTISRGSPGFGRFPGSNPLVYLERLVDPADDLGASGKSPWLTKTVILLFIPADMDRGATDRLNAQYQGNV